MEWLKDLLKDDIAEEKIDEVIDKYKKESPKHVMPKQVFNEKSEELKTIKAQLDEQKNLVEDLGKKADSVEEYETKLNEWQERYKQLESEAEQKVSQITKKSAYKELLLTNNVHTDAIDLLLDTAKFDDIELQDGKIKDGEQVVQRLKEQRAGLFITESQDSVIKKEEVQSKQLDPSSMTMEEYTRWFNEREQAN